MNYPRFTLLALAFLAFLEDFAVIGVGLVVTGVWRGVIGAAVTGASVGSLGSSISKAVGLVVGSFVGAVLGEVEGLEVGEVLYKFMKNEKVM